MTSSRQDRLRASSLTVLEASHMLVGPLAQVVLDRLDGLLDDEMLFLEARVRSWSDYWMPERLTPVNIDPSLFTHREPTVAQAAVALASMSSNGFTRQAAVERLDLSTSLGRRLCLIRTGDWVPQVAEAAVQRLSNAGADELVAVLPLIEQLAHRSRSTALRSLVEAALTTQEGRAALTTAALGETGASSRLAWYRLMRHHPEVIAEHVGAAVSHPDVRVRQRALEEVRAVTGPAREQALRLLADDPIGRIRADAQDLRFHDQTPTAATVEPLLFDRSRLVRMVGQTWWRRLGNDPCATYLAAIAEGPTRLAVFGLGEIGGPSDLPVLESLLASTAGEIRNAALVGIARLDPSVAEKHAYTLLEDESTRVTRSAITILAALQDGSNAITDFLLGRLVQEPRPRVRSYLLTALSTSSWHRLTASAFLRDDVDPGVRDRADEALKRWPNEIANLGSRPSPATWRELEQQLPGLETDLRRVIEFVLRTSP